jgi:hypothetical protein
MQSCLVNIGLQLCSIIWSLQLQKLDMCLMCSIFVVVSVVFIARNTCFYGFPTSTVGSMKANFFNLVHGTEI